MIKFKVSIQKKEGFVYSVENGFLKINETVIEEPVDQNIIEFEIDEAASSLGITKCYRNEEGELICNLTKYIEDLEPYKNYIIKNGKDSNQRSKWDFKKLMTAEEVVNGNVVQEAEESEII